VRPRPRSRCGRPRREFLDRAIARSTLLECRCTGGLDPGLARARAPDPAWARRGALRAVVAHWHSAGALPDARPRLGGLAHEVCGGVSRPSGRGGPERGAHARGGDLRRARDRGRHAGCDRPPQLLDFFHVAGALRSEAAIAFVAPQSPTASRTFGRSRARCSRASAPRRPEPHLDRRHTASARRGGRSAPAWPGSSRLVAASGVATLVGLGLSRAQSRTRARDPSRARAATFALWRRLTGYSAALQVVNLGVLVQFQLEKVLLPRFLGLGAVANFELGFRVAFGAWAVPTVLLAPLLAAHAHLEATGDSAGDRAALPAFVAAHCSRSQCQLLRHSWRSRRRFAPRGSGLAMVMRAGRQVRSRGCCGLTCSLRPVAWSRAHGASVDRGPLSAAFDGDSPSLGVGVDPSYGFGGGLASLVVSGTVGTFYFLWAFHRALGLAWAAYARRIVAPPALASAVAAALAWWTSVAVAGGDVASRGRALAGLFTGGGVFRGRSARGLVCHPLRHARRAEGSGSRAWRGPCAARREAPP